MLRMCSLRTVCIAVGTMLFQCSVETCNKQFSSRQAFRYHLTSAHNKDLRQTRQLVGHKFENVDEIYTPDAATLARLLNKWRKNRRLVGPRSRPEQRKRKREAAGLAGPELPAKTTLSPPVSIPSALSTIAQHTHITTHTTSSSSSSLPRVTATATLSSLSAPVPSTSFSGPVSAIRTSVPACRPAGYRSASSSSSSAGESDEDESIFGSLSPERLHSFEAFLLRDSTRGHRRGAEVHSAQTQTVPPPQPPSAELLSAIRTQVCHLVVAQPTWSPSRIRRAAFTNLCLPVPSDELRAAVDEMILDITSFEHSFSQYLSSAALLHCANPAVAILSAAHEFQLRMRRPTDN